MKSPYLLPDCTLSSTIRAVGSERQCLSIVTTTTCTFRPSSLSQYLDHHPFATLSVEPGIEYPLPGPQVQPTLGDRQQLLIADEERFEVGVFVAA
jgi:hypothetical protein